MHKLDLVWECYCLTGVSAPDEWRETLERCLEVSNCPYHFDIREFAIRIWNPKEPHFKVPNSDYICRNGYKLQRVAFGRQTRGTLIGLSLTRLVFKPGSHNPEFFSAAELFKRGKYPDVLRHEPMIVGIEQLINFFKKSLSGQQIVRHNEHSVEVHAESVNYRFGDKIVSLADICKPPGLSRNILNLIKSSRAITPASIYLGVLSKGSRNPHISLNIANEIVGVLQSWGCKSSYVDLRSGDNIDQFFNDSNKGKPIVLVPLDGKKGNRPSNSAIQWLRYLDSEKAAFQLCSTASNPLYSRHGLATAILSKADGSIFIVEPDGFSNFNNSWFIGLDLGRGGMNYGKVVVITLTGPSGKLEAYWRAIKDQDETLQPKLLKEGLSWIANEADRLVPNCDFYIIRDGRRPHNESVDSYREAVAGRDITLIEYMKSGSPLIHNSPTEPEPGVCILPDGSDFTAIYPCTSPQHKILTTPVKFRTPIGSYKHNPSLLSRLLTALCHSATLSFQPSRLPAPLQWANGLSRLSYTDLQFSGWSHRAKKLVNIDSS